MGKWGDLSGKVRGLGWGSEGICVGDGGTRVGKGDLNKAVRGHEWGSEGT